MAKNPKGRGGTSRLRLDPEINPLPWEHPATSATKVTRNQKNTPYGTPRQAGPKPVKLVAKQEE